MYIKTKYISADNHHQLPYSIQIQSTKRYSNYTQLKIQLRIFCFTKHVNITMPF